MPDCLNEQNRAEIERQYDRQDQQQEAEVAVSDKIYHLLNNNGFYAIWEILDDTPEFKAVLKTETKARYPHLYH